MAAGTTIGDLFVRLGVDMTAFNRDLGSAEGKLESFGTRLFFLGSRVSAGITLPMVAAGAAIAKVGLSFDKAMTESLAIMSNVTPQIRSQMEATAKAVATSTKFSAAEAAEGYYSLASAGLDAATSMRALPIAAQFAQAGVFDLAKATEYLAGATAAMGTGMETAEEKAQQMQRVADVLTEANNRALGTVKDFADALTNRGALALRQSNIELEAGVAILAAYAERNIRGAKAGQQLWMMLRDLQTHANKNAAAFKANEIAVYDATGAMRPMADILSDMQVRFEKLSVAGRAHMLDQLGIPARSRAATQAILGQAQAIRDHEEALKKAGGTTKEVADKQMEALSNQFLRLKNQIEIAAIEIFKSFIPAIRDSIIPAVERAIAVMKALGAIFVGLPAPVQTFTVSVLGLVAAIGPLTAIIGSMTLLTSAAFRGLGSVAGIMGRLATAGGLAAGGLNFAAVAAAQTGVATAMASSNAVKLSSASTTLTNAMEPLVQRQKDVWNATRMMAIQQGASASAAFSAANAARAAERAYQNNAIAAAGVAASTGLWAKALALLSNPITLTIGAVAGLGVAYYLLTRKVDTLTPELLENADAFRKKTDQMDRNLATIKSLSGWYEHHLIPTNELKKATTEMAKEVGLSTEAFKQEIIKSGELINNLDQLILRRRELAQANIDDAAAEQKSAQRSVDAIKARLALVESGKATLPYSTPMSRFTGEWEHRPMTMEQRQAAQAGLLKDLAKAEQQLTDAQNRLMQVSGMVPRSAKPVPTPKPPVIPTGLPTEMDEAAQAAKKYYDTLSGKDALKDLEAFRTAMRRLVVETKGNIPPDMLDRMWEPFQKVIKDAPTKEMTAMFDEFGHIFAGKFRQQEAGWIQDLTKGMVDMENTFSDTTNKFIEDADAAHASVLKFANNPAMTGAFWRKYEGAIKELMPAYDALPPKIQSLIRLYQEWKIAAGPSGEFQEGAQEAVNALNDAVDKSSAKLEDLGTSIHQFAEKSGTTQRRVLNSKLKEIENDQEKHYKQQLIGMARFTGKELDAYINKLETLRTNNAKILTETKRFETLRYMQSIGVNAKIIRDHERLKQEELDLITKRREAWLDLFRKLKGAAEGIAGMGKIADILGLDRLGASLSGVGAGANAFFDGLEQWQQAENTGQEIVSVAAMIGGLAQAYQALADTAGRANRMVSGALSGAMIGGAVGGPVGAGIGAGIGALVGGIMGDPDWAKVRSYIKKEWEVNISEELAKQIEATANRTGSRVSAMFAHIGQVIQEQGGLSAGNVSKWADEIMAGFEKLGKVRDRTGTPALKPEELLTGIDQVFADMAKAGTTANGVLSRQVVELVKLERQYRLGSAAIKEYVGAQMDLAATGLNQLTKGMFGSVTGGTEELDRLDSEQTQIQERIAKLKEKIAEYDEEGVKTEKDRVDLMLARIQLRQEERKLIESETKESQLVSRLSAFVGATGQVTEASQAQFDRLGRIALGTFDAMIAGGKGFAESLGAISESLDVMQTAQEMFGFASSESFAQLMKFSEFAKLNPELIGGLDGLNKVMTGLSNTGFMTQGMFTDLGLTAVDLFNKMVDGGLSSDEAMRFMQPTLQRLWELQKNFGLAVDETTQKLIDQGVESGAVGEKHMSATDRMVLGIDKLIGRFDLLLTRMGIDIPAEAGKAAGAIVDEFAQVNPKVKVGFVYYNENEPEMATPSPIEDPLMMAEGGVFTRPVVAGEAGPEAFIPLDRLFAELEAARRSGSDEIVIINKTYLDGRQVSQSNIRHQRNVLRQHGLG